MEILEFTSKEAAALLMSLAAPLWFWKFWKQIKNYGIFSRNFESFENYDEFWKKYEFKFPKWEANFDAGRGIYVASIAWSWKIEIKWSLSTGQEIHQISNWNSLNVEHQAGVIVINVALVALYSGRQLAWLNVGFALHIFPMRKLAAMQRVLGHLVSSTPWEPDQGVGKLVVGVCEGALVPLDSTQ